jgi:hypothetical protein
MEELARTSLYICLLVVKSGAIEKSGKLDLGKASRDEYS